MKTYSEGVTDGLEMAIQMMADGGFWDAVPAPGVDPPGVWTFDIDAALTELRREIEVRRLARSTGVAEVCDGHEAS